MFAKAKDLFLMFVLNLIVSGILVAKPGDVVQSFASPTSCPTGLVWDGTYLWLADRKVDKIFKLHPKDGSIKATLNSPGFWPMGLTWDGKYLWNADLEEKKIYRLDPETGTVIHTIDSPTPEPQGLAWDGQYLWVADRRVQKISQISPEDGTTIIEVPSPANSPNGLTWDGKYLWVSDRMQDEIYMITPDKGQVILILPAPGPYTWGLAWDGEYLWNVDYQKDTIYKLNLKDSERFSLKNERYATVEVTHQVRNYGPGMVKTLDVYLAVPPNLDYQQIEGEISYQPEPKEFVVDRWKQKLAHFQYHDVASGQFIHSGMKVKAKIYDIQYYLFPERTGTIEQIPRQIKEAYLVDGEKYRIHDPFIQQAAQQAVGDEKNAYWIARKIFDYVIERIRYEMVGGWNVAPTVLKRGTGSCSEYSFVYIALCRAAGLPARYVGSYAVRGDDASLDDVFHRLVEVYLPNYGWVPVDPSRGDKDSPRDQAAAFGYAYARLLITTVGGGGSEYLGWTYNASEKWSCDSPCKVHVETVAEWEPICEQ